jgi:hypothetical protein
MLGLIIKTGRIILIVSTEAGGKRTDEQTKAKQCPSDQRTLVNHKNHAKETTPSRRKGTKSGKNLQEKFSKRFE